MGGSKFNLELIFFLLRVSKTIPFRCSIQQNVKNKRRQTKSRPSIVKTLCNWMQYLGVLQGALTNKILVLEKH